MRLLLALAFLFQDIVGLTDFPVPPWPQEGVVPASMKDTYVFIDLPKNEYVIAYPENLGTENFAKDPGKMRVSRYALLRDVQPEFAVTITKVDATKLRYSYSITNGSSAKQSIDSVILALTEASVSETLKAPEGWFSAFQPPPPMPMMNVNFGRSFGYTALHNAAARGDNEMILFLISRGAKVDVVARNGNTVADMANGSRQRVQPYPETIALLEALGARINYKCVSC